MSFQNGLIGLAAPTPAKAAAQRRGTLRVNMETKALKDPRTWDWTELANFCRGWLDYLTVFNHSNGKFANVDVHPFHQLDLHDIHQKA